MSVAESDAFVFFGATGDLAYKKIFPALQALIRAGQLNMPIIGMARAGWTLDKLRERARDSLEHNGGVDADAFVKLSARLKYVGGDYQDPATYERLHAHVRVLDSTRTQPLSPALSPAYRGEGVRH